MQKPNSSADLSSASKLSIVPDFIDPNRRYTIPVATKLLGQSRQTTYNQFAAGTLTPIRDGRRVYVNGGEIIARSRVAK